MLMVVWLLGICGYMSQPIIKSIITQEYDKESQGGKILIF